MSNNKTRHVAYILKLELEGLKIDIDASTRETKPLTLQLPVTGSVRGCVIKNCYALPNQWAHKWWPVTGVHVCASVFLQENVPFIY